jgi:hypothetical protein
VLDGSQGGAAPPLARRRASHPPATITWTVDAARSLSSRAPRASSRRPRPARPGCLGGRPPGDRCVLAKPKRVSRWGGRHDEPPISCVRVDLHRALTDPPMCTGLSACYVYSSCVLLLSVGSRPSFTALCRRRAESRTPHFLGHRIEDSQRRWIVLRGFAEQEDRRHELKERL